MAQLERLRADQERLKKINEVPSQVQPFNYLDPQRQYCQTSMLPFANQVGSTIPVQYGAPLYGAPSPVGTGRGCLMVQKGGHEGGFGGLRCSGWSGMGRLLMLDHLGVDPYGGVGNPDPRALAGTAFETSKELSSMPKMHCGPQNCDVCFKKTRFIRGHIGLNGERDIYTELSPVNGSDFLGSNLESTPNFTGEDSRFGAKAPSRTAGRIFDEGVEVMAIHRQGNEKGGSVLMEYEFFPGKIGRGTSSKGVELPTTASVAVGGEASFLTSAAYSSTSNSVDLSLKLSY